MLLTLWGCAGRDEPALLPPPQAIATVGDATISVALVKAVATARSLPAARALENVARDTRWFLESRSQGFFASENAAWHHAWAQALLNTLADAARAEGPPSEAELALWADKHWGEAPLPARVGTRAEFEQLVGPQIIGARAQAARRALVQTLPRSPQFAENVDGLVSLITFADP